MWVLYAIIASITGAFYYLSIQNIKINTNVFMIYRGFIITTLLLPIILLYPIKFSLIFYLMSILQGIIVAYSDYLCFRLNKNYGSETISSITPLSVVIVFILWCFISPSTVLAYTTNPIQTVFIIFSLLGVVYALINYRKTPLTSKALTFLIPVLFLSSAISILNKLIMSYSESSPLLCACWRVLILSLIIGTIHSGIYIKKKLPLKDLINPQNLKQGKVFILLLIALISKSLAMLYTQNPAYVSCIIYLTPIWIMIFGHIFPVFKFKWHKKQIQKKYEILFIVSVIILILLTI